MAESEDGMQFDFDTVTDRRGSGSLKWDVKEGELPMWVADMDFQTAPCVREALEKRAAHGVFGYQIVPDAWYEAYISWWRDRHGLQLQKEWLVFTTGVIPALSSAVRKLTSPAEKVVVMTPVYNIFFNSILNNGRVPLECPLLYHETEGYEIDFELLEKALADPQTSLLLLCNPHNPVGKIWSRQELEKIGELCKANSVVVFSDEIHCDLTAPGLEYVPFASVSETCRQISITAVAPTKAFNLAGLQTAAFFSANGTLRWKLERAVNTDEVAEPNAFAIDAAVAAFTQGGEWLDALREYLQKNKQKVTSYLAEHIPGLRVVSTDVTYLLWIDLSKILDGVSVAGSRNGETREATGHDFVRFLRKETGLFVSDGCIYGSGGEKFLRLNVACPAALVEDGLQRLKEGVLGWTVWQNKVYP